MQQFKQEQGTVLNIDNYSEDQVSLLNSRKRHHLDTSEHETDSENQQQIRQFKRQIQERFKISIANKIYTFPKVITNVEDIVSSDEEALVPEVTSKNRQHMVESGFIKKTQTTKKSDSFRQFESNNSKNCKQKIKTSDSTIKRKEDQKTKSIKNQKSNGKKNKKEVSKTEQDSYMQTLRNKAQKKN